MINMLPPQPINLLPPIRIPFITRHDHGKYHRRAVRVAELAAGAMLEFVLDLLNADFELGVRGEALGLGIHAGVADVAEVTVSCVDDDKLDNAKCYDE